MTELPTELIGEFMNAVVEDSSKAERLLSQHPALLNARWMNNETVLHFLAIEGFEDAVRFLIAHGADVNPVNMFGDSPLTDVAGLGRDRIAAILLAAGADPNGSSTPDRDRPLHSAARQGEIQLATLLLNAGADPRYVGSFGDTIFQAVDEAPSESRQQILALGDHALARDRRELDHRLHFGLQVRDDRVDLLAIQRVSSRLSRLPYQAI